jgi:hypothetical protein
MRKEPSPNQRLSVKEEFFWLSTRLYRESEGYRECRIDRDGFYLRC